MTGDERVDELAGDEGAPAEARYGEADDRYDREADDRDNDENEDVAERDDEDKDSSGPDDEYDDEDKDEYNEGVEDNDEFAEDDEGEYDAAEGLGFDNEVRVDDEEPNEVRLDDEEPEFATVATGADVDEAKRTALAQLRKIVPWVTEADVEYEVVEEGARGGFFGRGRKGAQVEARVRSSAEPPDADLEPLAEDLREFLGEVVERMGLDAHVDVHDEGDAVIADLSGPDLGILIGRHGQTIDALQYVCAIAVNRRRKSRRRVIVDAEGYRDRRASSLHSMADRVAQRVAREREPVMLKPMSAAERKVIHLRLKDNPKVETSSEGQEPNRAVVVAPKSVSR